MKSSNWIAIFMDANGKKLEICKLQDLVMWQLHYLNLLKSIVQQQQLQQNQQQQLQQNQQQNQQNQQQLQQNQHSWANLKQKYNPLDNALFHVERVYKPICHYFAKR